MPIAAVAQKLVASIKRMYLTLELTGARQACLSWLWREIRLRRSNIMGTTVNFTLETSWNRTVFQLPSPIPLLKRI